MSSDESPFPPQTLWTEENTPVAGFYGTMYSLRIPHAIDGKRATVYVLVDAIGEMINIQPYTFWFGKDLKDYSVQREIFDWLVEWEFAEWKAIGPEDSELFATEKLTSTKASNQL